jgi:hypothetical protein
MKAIARRVRKSGFAIHLTASGPRPQFRRTTPESSPAAPGAPVPFEPIDRVPSLTAGDPEETTNDSVQDVDGADCSWRGGSHLGCHAGFGRPSGRGMAKCRSRGRCRRRWRGRRRCGIRRVLLRVRLWQIRISWSVRRRSLLLTAPTSENPSRQRGALAPLIRSARHSARSAFSWTKPEASAKRKAPPKRGEFDP